MAEKDNRSITHHNPSATLKATEQASDFNYQPLTFVARAQRYERSGKYEPCELILIEPLLVGERSRWRADGPEEPVDG
jgi:hypothetical protein